ncbi:hypothetical protein HEK616_62830 [Streptomyces nigrescens]|uniref:Secreted protein n=1 Tax=Streptomyces nigrescens TaxID=1920 RepID=A0ABN6R472_STRNI|nr:hypothetical protein HEK616_62830 [Streptomyces nigrescens]
MAAAAAATEVGLVVAMVGVAMAGAAAPYSRVAADIPSASESERADHSRRAAQGLGSAARVAPVRGAAVPGRAPGVAPGRLIASRHWAA